MNSPQLPISQASSLDSRLASRLKVFNRLSILAFALTLILVVLGGVVHNTGSSLACPDWPLCFGQVMPVMEGAVAIEHSHRLLATLVGFVSIFWILDYGRFGTEKFLSKSLLDGFLWVYIGLGSFFFAKRAPAKFFCIN